MEKSLKRTSAAWEFVKTLIIAIIFTMLLVLIFAIIVRFCSVESKYIPIVNQVIKCLSIVSAILLCFSKRPNGWLRGFLFGVVYALAAFLVFSTFSGKFYFGIKLLNDCVLGGVTGLVGGIIAVNVKKEK